MTTNTSGVITDQVVQSKTKDGKRIKVNEEWYGAFDPAQAGLDLVNYGDTVSFTFTVKETPTTTFRNIKGKVQVSATGGTGATSYGGGSKPASAAASKAGFPVGARDHSRSIIRQNSITNAVNFYNSWGEVEVETKKSFEEKANIVVEIAQIFEAYSTGDMDVAQAEAAVAKTLAGGNSNANIVGIPE